MYRFIETLKLKDGQLLFLQDHQRRMERTFANFFCGKKVPALQDALGSLPSKGEFRVRVLYDVKIQKTEVFPLIPRNFVSLQLVETDLNYDFKFADRKTLQSLYESRRNADEILIIRDGLITDTSISNVCFFDGQDWFTPESCLLEGTARERLLKEGRIDTRKITVNDLGNYQKVRLINSLIDFEDETDIPIDLLTKIGKRS